MGAGVILVEHYISRDMTSRIIRSGLAVILFRDRKTGKYTDAGGSSNDGECLEKCAGRELTEESMGLFDIDLENRRLSKHKVSLSSGYSAFVVPIRHPNGIKREYFTKNCECILGTADVPYYLKETDDMRRFFIDDLDNLSIFTSNSRKAAQIGIPDAYGSICFISKRTACVLQKAHSSGIFKKRMNWNYLHYGKSSILSMSMRTYTTNMTSMWGSCQREVTSSDISNELMKCIV